MTESERAAVLAIETGEALSDEALDALAKGTAVRTEANRDAIERIEDAVARIEHVVGELARQMVELNDRVDRALRFADADRTIANTVIQRALTAFATLGNAPTVPPPGGCACGAGRE